MFVILTSSDLSFIKAAHSSPIKTISHSPDLSDFFFLLLIPKNKKDDRSININYCTSKSCYNRLFSYRK